MNKYNTISPTIETTLMKMKTGEIKKIKNIILKRMGHNSWILTPWINNQIGYPLQEIISKLVT